MLGPTGEPIVPELLLTGVDEHGPWIVIPYYLGRGLGLTDPVPGPVMSGIARIHQRFMDRTHWPESFERIDQSFCHRALSGFATENIQRASAATLPRPYLRRIRDLVATLLENPAFSARPTGFPPPCCTEICMR